MPEYTQDNKLIAIESDLGKDVLLLSGFSGTEGLSMPFNFELEMFSKKKDLSYKHILGKKVTISVKLADGDKRFFHGVISTFSRGASYQTDDGTHLVNCSATMVPWLWLLNNTVDSRIFQNLSVLQIVEKIFSDNGLSDYKILTEDTYKQREYCVQYKETDFNFFSRLLEEEGIYYFFEHEHGKHTLVLADRPEKHKPCPKQETAKFREAIGNANEEDTIESLDRKDEIRVAKYTLSDYNFIIPNTNLTVETPTQFGIGPGEREIFYYPANYAKRTDGERLSKLRMQSEEVQMASIFGVSNCRAFTSGYSFDFLVETGSRFSFDFQVESGSSTGSTGKKYVLVSISHSSKQGYTSDDAASEFSYSNSFACIPFDVPFRPPYNALKPVVEGIQTAIVVGPGGGEEIYTDEHGRVKVQFHWDRRGQRNENSSCWVRVSQVWAGAGWGAMHIPRIGHEVVVDFEEGDPDRPLITGRVYHGNNRPPYPLPDEKTKSTIKSDSSRGGGGSNELRFEDKKGAEEVYLHGQKDWTIAIENDKNQTVGNNETLSVGSNRTKQVGKNQKETIGINKTIQVGANHTENIGGNMVQSIDSAKTETIKLAKMLTIGLGYQVTVGAGMNETVGAAKAEEIGGAKVEVIGEYRKEIVAGDKSVSIGGEQKETIKGKHTFKAKEIMIEAEDKITITCGASSISMDKDGYIKISGKTVDVEAESEIGITAQSRLDMDGGTFSLKATSGEGSTEATTILHLKGAQTKINC